MLGGKFIVSLHDNILFVLDAMSGVVVGSVAFRESIKSISTSGGFLYILTNVASKGTVIVRVAVHHSFVTADSEQWKALSPAATSVNCSPVGTPMGSSECLIKDIQELPRVINEQMCDESVQGRLTVEKSRVQQPGDSIESLASGCIDPPTILVSVEKSMTETVSQDLAEIPTRFSSKSNSEGLKLQDDSLVIDYESVQKADTMDLLQPIQSSVTQIQPEAKEQKDSDSIFTTFDANNEQSRRVRMSQATNDEIVADSKSHRRKRKKVKGKKLSSAGSKYTIVGVPKLTSYCGSWWGIFLRDQ